jgi:hypothetical protein
LRPFFICETPVRKRPRLTRARLRALLHYHPKTGEFRWRRRYHNRIRVGHLAGSVDRKHGARFIRIARRAYSEHQLAWFYMTGRWGRPSIDHRDGDVANNRWNNLRRATLSQNNANRRRPRHNTSGYKGVCLCRKSGLWRACIGKGGQYIQLGRFSTPQAAHAAYVAAARKLFGEFARAE